MNKLVKELGYNYTFDYWIKDHEFCGVYLTIHAYSSIWRYEMMRDFI